jgi:hypothetical protein
MAMEKHGRIDESTPTERPQPAAKGPLPQTKEALDQRAEHLTTRLAREAAEAAKRKS